MGSEEDECEAESTINEQIQSVSSDILEIEEIKFTNMIKQMSDVTFGGK